MQDGGSNSVMLCSRPNQAAHSQTQKPFCGRVVNRDQLGLVPVKDQNGIKISPKNRHKKWLQSFKKDLQSKKNQLQQNKKQQQQKFKKIRQQAQGDRQRARKMKQQYNQTATHVLNILDNQPLPKITTNQLTPDNLNKLNKINQIKQTQARSSVHQKQTRNYQNTNNDQKDNIFKKKKKQSKPLWAQTQQQIQKNQQNQVDQLLDFFTTNHVQDYAQDNNVKDILSNLKNKIQKLQEQQDWKQKQMERIQQKKEQRQRRRQQRQQNGNNSDQDDKYTHFSGHSEGRSVASQKTQPKKKQQQEWDNISTSQKSSIANIDQKIAKNIADQVLRNYPNLRGVHSNVSIRKLLQQQAAKVINQPIARPIITTIIKQKQKIDANNLPYLHRNPAI